MLSYKFEIPKRNFVSKITWSQKLMADEIEEKNIFKKIVESLEISV